jgi:hypothetical protein
MKTTISYHDLRSARSGNSGKAGSGINNNKSNKALTGRSQMYKAFMVLIFLTGFSTLVMAQDPGLPPTNLGLANVYDGVAGKPGFVYQGYAQFFQTRKLNDGTGNDTRSGLKVNSLLQMNQLIYLSPVKVLGGNLGFTVLVPIVQITSSNLTGPAPTVNPGVVGDIVEGTAIQWSDKKLFGLPFFHRVEFDVNMPTGAYNQQYNINESSHLWAFGAYHAFTLMLNKSWSISSRNQFNYNSNFIGQKDKPGAYYNGNYSIDYSIIPSLKLEAASYFLAQFNQDSYGGNSHYYLDQFGIANTKERVFGYGPGLAYFAPNGVLIEAKVFFETAAQNRLEGTRPTLRIAIPLSK